MLELIELIPVLPALIEMGLDINTMLILGLGTYVVKKLRSTEYRLNRNCRITGLLLEASGVKVEKKLLNEIAEELKGDK